MIAHRGKDAERAARIYDAIGHARKRGLDTVDGAHATNMKVSILSTWDAQCGIAGYTAGLVDSLRTDGVEVDVVAIDRPQTVYMPVTELMGYFASLGRQLAEADIAHIQHEFGIYAGAYGYSVSTAVLRDLLQELAVHRVPSAITLHTEPFGTLQERRHVGRMAYQAYLKTLWRLRICTLPATSPFEVVVHTRASRRATIDSGIPAGRVHLIRMGVPLPSTGSTEERLASRVRLGFDEDTVVLAQFGFLEPYKGYDVALEALKRLPSNFHLVIVGGTHPFSRSATVDRILERVEKDRELVGRVTLRGYVPHEELRLYQEAVDMCIAPYHDRTPLSSSAALAWALASGKPIVASAIPPFVELAGYMDCLELVTPDAPRELANTIERLIGDPDRRRDLGYQATQYCERHSWPSAADEHVRLYEQLRAPSGRRAAALLSRAGLRLIRDAVDNRLGGSAGDGGRPPGKAAELQDVAVRVGGRRLWLTVDPGSTDPIGRAIMEHGLPAEPGISLMRAVLDPNDVMLDIGAHLGMYALTAAAFGSEVFAIEANRRQAEMLRRAAARNGFDQLTVIHGAAGPSRDSVRFCEKGPWGFVSPHEDGAEAREVPGIVVDDLLHEHAIDRVGLVKIDVEGSEPGVIDGMDRLLSREDAPLVLFESNAPMLKYVSGCGYVDLHRRLEGFGFELYLLDHHRPGRLTPVRSGDLMPHAVMEYLAAKHLPADIAPWYVGSPLGEDEVVRQLVLASRSDHPPYRAWVASTIASGPEWLGSNSVVAQIARRLSGDPSAEVREALASR